MIELSTRLNRAGISAATGNGLVGTRDQSKAASLRGNGNAADNQSASGGTDGNTKSASAQELTLQQQQKVVELQQIDRKVRIHEQAHMAAGGGIVTSGPNYTYTYGPDGKSYASAGEVGIDTAAENKPQQNIDKGQQIQRAALAPQDPSPQDYRVASTGAHLEAQGRSDLSSEQTQERAANAQAARQRREAQAAGPDGSLSNAATAETAAGASARDKRLLVNTAYATVANGSANAGRVSVFA